MVQQKDVIMEVLKDVPDDAILYLSVDGANYYMAMLTAMEYLKNSAKISGIYVGAARSADKILRQLKLEKIDTQGLFYVDTVAALSGAQTDLKGVQMVESPAMLEIILLKIKWFARHIKSEKRFVFVDSINALAVYNESKLLCEFLHVLVNLMNAKEIWTILLSVEELTPPDVRQVMQLSSDDILEIKEEGVSLNGKLKTMLGERDL